MEREAQTGAVKETTAARLWVILVRAYRSMAEVLEAGIAEEGMCLSDFFVLEVLLHAGEGQGALSISEIGTKVQLANASMTSLVDRLARRGLVERVTSAEDRRVRLVSLTDHGRAQIEAVYARHEREIEELMAEVPQADREVMRRGLRTMGLTAKAVAEERVRTRREHGREPAKAEGCGTERPCGAERAGEEVVTKSRTKE